MSQVTEAFCHQMLVHVNRSEHAPLTIGEQRQLAYAWLELNRLGTKSEDPEVLRLRDLAATCYAGLGAACGLPERWLDVLSAAANGQPFDTGDLLPFTAASTPA